MKLPVYAKSFCFLAGLSLTAILAGLFVITATSQCRGAQPAVATAAAQNDDDSDDWMFDKSTYTNDPKTGKRVDQFKKEKTPYRDPNAFFDSPMDTLSIFGGYLGGFYDNYNPFNYYSTLTEFMGNYFYGNDSDKYYPYDGDPNDEEEDMDQ
ncbi:MAG: hypothetical protein ABSG67_16065 [Thermoguttaceae bacterium]|jgi:hypothetical protein